MVTYVVLINLTDQGIRTIKDSPSRAETVMKMLEERGGRITDYYLTMGAYDFVVIFEMPSDEEMAKMLLFVGSQGNVRTTALKAFGEDEYRKIVAELPA